MTGWVGFKRLPIQRCCARRRLDLLEAVSVSSNLCLKRLMFAQVRCGAHEFFNRARGRVLPLVLRDPAAVRALFRPVALRGNYNSVALY